MTVKELAKCFNVSIGEIIKTSGYSKQGLYNVFSENYKLNKGKFEEMLNQLKALNVKEYQNGLVKLEKMRRMRENAIKELEKRLECEE